MTTAGSRAILPRLAAFTFDLCVTKKEKKVEGSKVTLSRFFAQELGFVVANPSITLNTIHYKHKRLHVYTKKNSYLMSRISFYIIPGKIHIHVLLIFSAVPLTINATMCHLPHLGHLQII